MDFPQSKELKTKLKNLITNFYNFLKKFYERKTKFKFKLIFNRIYLI